jgi:hypothetical protein
MDPADLRELAEAKRLLEVPGLAARLTSALGTPVEKGIELLPAGWNARIQRATRRALDRALAVALRSLGDSTARRRPSNRLHRLAAGASGAAGGALGLASLVVELPVSTVIMLRSIADIARSEGEELSRLDARLACLEVFALGGRSPGDDAAETGYFAVRAALGRAVSEAVGFLGERGMVKEGAPVLVRFLAVVAERFGVVVSEKAAASLVPVIGAFGGATINVIFLDHFQGVARGHFIVRRLERKYGEVAVRAAFEGLAPHRQ